MCRRWSTKELSAPRVHFQLKAARGVHLRHSQLMVRSGGNWAWDRVRQLDSSHSALDPLNPPGSGDVEAQEGIPGLLSLIF